jgi:hypothetical protein
VKVPSGVNAIPILRDSFAEIESRKISSKVHVDVDPLSLL